MTARTADSIPKHVLLRREQEKNLWLGQLEIRLGIPVRCGRHWKEVLDELTDADRKNFTKRFNRQREVELDLCHGRCWLREPEYSKIIADSLMHFDRTRYRMGDFVIMPNHMRFLAVFSNPKSMESQISSWLHWTATQINRKTGFLVRSVEQCECLRRYIADNPKKANLREGEYLYRRLPE